MQVRELESSNAADNRTLSQLDDELGRVSHTFDSLQSELRDVTTAGRRLQAQVPAMQSQANRRHDATADLQAQADELRVRADWLVRWCALCLFASAFLCRSTHVNIHVGSCV